MNRQQLRRDEPHFAPSHFAAEPVPAMRPCPRCGRQMLLGISYYECPACLYIERKPSRYQTGRNERVNRLLAALQHALPGWARALRQRDPLLQNPPADYELPPELSFERTCLLLAWLAPVLLIIVPGEHLAGSTNPPVAQLTGLTFLYLVITAILIPLALYSTLELLRWIGFGWAALWIALSFIGLWSVPVNLADLMQLADLPRWLPLVVEPVLLVYYLWFASFMYRDLARLREK
jgi:hypothetical protein